MADIPCDIPCITCAPPPPGTEGLGLAPSDPSNPFVNFSSEAPDVDLFPGRSYGGQLPPLGSTWYSVGCLGFCLSTESQDDADVCAENQSVFCQSVNWPVPSPNAPSGGRPQGKVPRKTFFNNAQFCSYTCPDGTLFTFTVNPGFFIAFSVAAANAKAYKYACKKARENHVCLGDMTNATSCLNGVCNSKVSAQTSKKNLPVSFSIVGGSLPPGLFLVMSNEATLGFGGSPTMAGDFPVRIRATTSIAATSEKDFVIHVFGISDGSGLPDAVLGQAYSHQLSYAGTLRAVVFSIIGGVLPDGLTMSTDGYISGTPTVDGAFQIAACVEEI